MDFQDFPMILGNLGVETEHPPKMCAGLAQGAKKATPASGCLKTWNVEVVFLGSHSAMK